MLLVLGLLVFVWKSSDRIDGRQLQCNDVVYREEYDCEVLAEAQESRREGDQKVSSRLSDLRWGYLFFGDQIRPHRLSDLISEKRYP